MYLNCHSYYSLRYGTISIDDLVAKAKALQVPKLCLTDINNSTGVLEFVNVCNQHNIEAVAGMEFRNDNTLLYIGIAKNNKGYKELNDWLTLHTLQHQPISETPPYFENVFIIYPYDEFKKKNLKPTELKPYEFIGIGLKDLSRVQLQNKIARDKYVLQQPITYLNSADYNMHCRLRAIDNNILLSQITPEMKAGNNEYFIPEQEILKSLENFPEIVSTTKHLLNQCSFVFDFKTIKNKKLYTTSSTDDKQLLEKLAMDGMKYRYGTNNKEAHNRIRNELKVINDLGFCSYFLITWDVIRYSLNRGFYHVGRGSGANSVVAYCLKITDVCPIELDLYFERFLNPKRKSPPDFDIDYSWRERDEVLDYIFKRYGKEHTALLGTISTFKDRSIIRELGKVYGLPKDEIDMLAATKSRGQFKTDDSIISEILSFEEQISNSPNMRSIHAGGVLISDEPITNYIALDLPPKDLPTAQFDMYLAEDIGFEKLDILSQRGIGHIKEASEIVYKNRGVKIDVHDVGKFKQDAQVRLQLKSGDTIGCFYIESPAMRGLLKKLKCDNYLTLVAASSIIRPGVAKSGMMKAYIQRFHNPNNIDYLHPVMEEQLKETYGVMVFQEDVLKVGHHYGGLDLADADVLRRLMSGKNRGKHHLIEIQEKFFSNAKEKGYPEHITAEVWRQIESFAGYSFSKAHSASYAVESFQSLYLKAHYPLEFMVAVINNFGGFYSRWVYFNEARRGGATIHLPCVNKSTYYTTIYGKDIYVGFVHIENFEQKFAHNIEDERLKGGDFVSLDNFINRMQIGLEQVLLLIRLNAFRFTSITKKNLLWNAHLLLGNKMPVVAETALFYEPPKEHHLPVLIENNIENAYDEMELIGFPITLSRFDLLQTKQRLNTRANNLIEYVGQTIRIMGDYVAYKGVRTTTGKYMAFGTFVDEDGNFFDTTHFPPSLAKYSFTGSGIYLILGKVVQEFGFPSIEVDKFQRLGYVKNPIAG